MSERTDQDFLSDIREAIQRISVYVAGLDYETFVKDTKTQDAVIRNLEILDEATKNLSETFRTAYAGVPWKSMAGARDRLIHHYFGVNLDIVWQIVSTELPRVTEQLPSRENSAMIQEILQRVSADRIRRDLFYLCRDPLPFRKVNYTRPGQSANSLAEADGFIRGQLESAGYAVTSTAHRVQAFRCDDTKPLHHWYSTPDPDDPWYDAANLEAVRTGREHPGEIIQLISHKDSMSWIDSPGAHDNAVGTVANLELARILANCDLRRSVRVLFCNEEHTPWTSRFAAEAAAARGDRIIAVLNVDSLDGKSDEEMAAGKLAHVVGYSTDEGRPLAEFVAACATRYGVGLEVRVFFKERVNDDDGMFINAGYRTTVMNCGSWPYADSEYHLPGDVPERVNIENVVRSAQLLLAAILEIDAAGAGAFLKT